MRKAEFYFAPEALLGPAPPHFKINIVFLCTVDWSETSYNDTRQSAQFLVTGFCYFGPGMLWAHQLNFQSFVSDRHRRSVLFALVLCPLVKYRRLGLFIRTIARAWIVEITCDQSQIITKTTLFGYLTTEHHILYCYFSNRVIFADFDESFMLA